MSPKSGLMVSVKKIPDKDHVLRHVPWTKLRKDENDNVLGILAAGLQRRPGEKSLSVTWIEYFTGSAEEQALGAIRATRAAQDCRPKSQFAIANVGKTKEAAASKGAKIRIVHEATEGNPAHASIRQLPDEDSALLELLAEDVFTQLIPNASVGNPRS
jgi:hypothetical protein